jgi:hypothetical protein
MGIASKAVIVRLHQGRVPFSVKDKSITKETNARMGITEGMGHFTKAIYSKKATECVTKPYGEQYRYHLSVTLPFNDKGARIVSSKAFLDYTAKMRVHESLCMKGAETFMANRTSNIAEAQILLDTAFRTEDYPTESEMRDRFSITVRVEPIPENIVLDGILADELKDFQADHEANIQKAVGNAMTDAWRRIYEVASKCAESLKNPEKVFRDSLIGNVRELVEVLPSLNVTDDPNLDEARNQLQERIASMYPADLRGTSPSCKAFRAETAKAAEEIAANAAYYMNPTSDIFDMVGDEHKA